MNSLDFQCLEGSFLLYPMEDSTQPMTVETWFIQRGLITMRRTLYKVYSGEVVAIQDKGVCGDPRLNVDRAFLDHYIGEPELQAILDYSGVHDVRKVGIFEMGV